MAEETPNRLRELLMGDPGAEDATARAGVLKTSGLSVEKFARAVGVTRTSLYFYVRDRSRPTAATLHKICEQAGITFEEGLTYCTPRTTGRQPAPR